MSGVVLGLLAALAWGFSDFLAQKASRRLGAMQAAFYAQGIGLLGLLVFMLLTGHPLFPVDAVAWAWALLSAVLGTLGGVSFYQSARLGNLAVVAPIMGSYGAVTTVLAWLNGEEMSGMVSLGLLSALLAVVLVSRPREAQRLRQTPEQVRGVWWAILAALALGACFFVMGHGLTPRLGGVQATWAMRLLSLLLLFLSLRGLRQPADLPAPEALLPPALTGLLSVTAVVFIALGLGHGQDGIVTVLGSMSVVITTLLALTLNGERLGRLQAAGVLLAILGTLLISL